MVNKIPPRQRNRGNRSDDGWFVSKSFDKSQRDSIREGFDFIKSSMKDDCPKDEAKEDTLDPA